MEILVPGLLLVGLMIWASTRIKRNALRAFEREEIETPGFSLTKPEGFLSIVDPPNGLAFAAYSKEYGTEPAEHVRRAAAEVSRFSDAHFEEVVERAKIGSTSVVSEQTGIIGGRKCANIVVERLDQDAALVSYYKILAGDGAIFQLFITVLPEHKDDFQRGIDELLGSFILA